MWLNVFQVQRGNLKPGVAPTFTAAVPRSPWSRDFCPLLDRKPATVFHMNSAKVAVQVAVTNV